MDDLVLTVNGNDYAGWTSLAVTRAMDAASGAFTVELTERWEGNGTSAAQVEPWPILPGDKCEVLLAGVPMISGYVDIFRPSFSATSHTINIQGRDKTSDLIDCSAIHKPDEWRGINILAFAQILAKPFEVSVSADVDVGAPFPVIKLQQGETAFEAIDRYAKQRKLLLMPAAGGGLLLTRIGSKRAATALIQGQNILSASGSIDYSDRFSSYLVKGQTGFSIDSDGEAEAHIEGGVNDPGVSRYRPKLIIAEAGGSGGSAKDRAIWEANVRTGKSASAEITVQGWRQSPGGALWEPNLLVQVRSPWLRLDGEMVIRQVVFERNSGGTTAKLSVVSPQAFASEAPREATRSAGKRNIWAEAIGDDDK